MLYGVAGSRDDSESLSLGLPLNYDSKPEINNNICSLVKDLKKFLECVRNDHICWEYDGQDRCHPCCEGSAAEGGRQTRNQANSEFFYELGGK